MNISQKNYFNIEINEKNHTYYFTTTDKKPEGKNSALKTLKKIEKVIEKDYLFKAENVQTLPKGLQETYDKMKELPLLNKKKEALEILETISTQIRTNYNKSTEGLSFFTKIFSRFNVNRQVRRIHSLCKRGIREINVSNPLLKIPSLLLAEKIHSEASLKSLKILAKEKGPIAGVTAKRAIIAKAKEWGYEIQSNDENKNYKEANAFIEALFYQMQKVSYRTNFFKIPVGIVEPEEIVKYYQQKMTAGQLVDIWDALGLNSQDVREEFPEFISFLTKNPPSPIAQIDDNLRNKLSNIFQGAGQYGEVRALKMFLNLVDWKAIQEDDARALLKRAMGACLVWNRVEHLKLVLEKYKLLDMKPSNDIDISNVNEKVIMALKEGNWEINEKNSNGFHSFSQFFPFVHDAIGDRMVHAFFQWKYYPIIQAFLKNGAHPNIKIDDKGNTPLHYAAKFGFTKLTKLLLDHKANMDAKNDDGKTPLDVAGELGSSRHRKIKSIFDESIKKKDL